ncbi:MAG: sugar transferase [Ilumatobacteraceae bacterium]
MLVLWPVAVVVWLTIAVGMGRPVLFRQVRAGRLGRPIRITKFRTMSSATAEDGTPLVDADRLTRLGGALRATSLDELPQLWSVLRGDMSIVGPRPLPLVYLDRYSAEQRRRLEAKPGITGWAQVNGRNEVAWPDRLALDVWYVDHASPRLDATIVVRTIRSVVRRHGVSATGHATMPEFTGDS